MSFATGGAEGFSSRHRRTRASLNARPRRPRRARPPADARSRSAASAASRSTPPPVLERASRTAQRSERNDTRQKILLHLFVTENPLINSPKNILKVGRDFFVLFRAFNKINTTRTFEARRARGSLSLPPSPVSAEWEQAGAHVPRAQVETRGHEIPRAFLAGERGRVVFRRRPLGKNLPQRWRTNTTRSRPRGRRRGTAGSSVGFGRLRSAGSSAPIATAGRWRTRAAGSSAPTGTAGRWRTSGWRDHPLEPRSRLGASPGGRRLREPFRVAAFRRAARLRDGRRAVRVEHEHAVVGS